MVDLGMIYSASLGKHHTASFPQYHCFPVAQHIQDTEPPLYLSIPKIKEIWHMSYSYGYFPSQFVTFVILTLTFPCIQAHCFSYILQFMRDIRSISGSAN